MSARPTPTRSSGAALAGAASIRVVATAPRTASAILPRRRSTVALPRAGMPLTTAPKSTGTARKGRKAGSVRFGSLAARGGGGLFRDRADIPHQRQRVPVRPRLSDLAALVAVD